MLTTPFERKPGVAQSPEATGPDFDKIHTPATASDFPTLGWPFAAMAAATINWDNARQRAWAATVAADTNAREKAILEQFEAMGERQKLRNELADVTIGGLRIAVADQSAALEAVLDGIVENLPSHKQLVARIEEQDEVIRLLLDRIGGRAAA